ncbi:MAG: radical SAM protein, partial [Nitrospiria bacterium]
MRTPDLSFAKLDFSQTPFLVIWEMTQACDLVCRHCRASAIPERCPEELTTKEGRRLLDEIKGMGTPVVVLSGGDSLKRPDLQDLI